MTELLVLHSAPQLMLVEKAELPFLHSARHLMLIDICIKFRA